MGNDFELLLVKDKGTYWEVTGTTYSNALLANPTLVTVRASFLAVQEVKKHLAEGRSVRISKQLEFTEAQPKDLVVCEADELTVRKNIAVNDICTMMHQAVIGVCVLDAMDYMQSFMHLANNGIFITDQNREDKYLEIIEKSQELEDPGELPEGASFEEEQQHLEAKRQHDIAQDNLKCLEKYLNAYDRLFKIKYVTDTLDEAKTAVQSAEDMQQLEEAVAAYKAKLSAFQEKA